MISPGLSLRTTLFSRITSAWVTIAISSAVNRDAPGSWSAAR